MQAKLKGDSYVVTLTPAEAHVLIWGGPVSVVAAVEGQLRNALVTIEDATSEDDYAARFGDLDAMYAQLLTEAGMQNA